MTHRAYTNCSMPSNHCADVSFRSETDQILSHGGTRVGRFTRGDLAAGDRDLDGAGYGFESDLLVDAV
jgi:hypothetical protein